MFKELFKKYRKYTQNELKPVEELEKDFDKIKVEHAALVTSELYALFKEYYLARIELNRDELEKDLDEKETQRLRAENDVMRRFILDIEDMKEVVDW